MPCSKHCVSAVADDIVVRLRTNFLKRAVMRIRELASHGEIDEALVGGTELRRYFEWVKDDIPFAERGPLLEQIQTLPGNFKTSPDTR